MRGRASKSACRSPGPEYTMAIKIVLADDHPLVLDGLEQLFSAEQDIKVVARCMDGEAALAAVRKHRPDVVVLDLRMPVKDGLEVLRQIRLEKLPTRVVVLTAALDEDDVVEAIRLGAPGVVRSEEHTSELQSLAYLVCRLLLEKKKKITNLSELLLGIVYSLVVDSM